jgi:hypothetical protein
MRRTAFLLFIGALSLAAACIPPVNPTPPPATAPAREIGLSGAAVMIGAGDIAGCDQDDDLATAILVDSILKADSAAGVPTAVFTLGDNVYPSGTNADFANCFTPTWGDPKRRIMGNIHPSTGNHDYHSADAAPYFKYFGDKAGEAGKGYYSYDVGTWHVAVINSALQILGQYAGARRAAQEDWLLKDLADNKLKKCTIVYWHEPRFSSGWHGSETRMASIWRIAYENDVDLVLNGHDHNYERFAPQTPDAVADSTRGITQIVAGMGGGSERGFGGMIAANSRARIEGHVGVLMLTLGAAEWRSAYLDTVGRIWDPSGGKCH